MVGKADAYDHATSLYDQVSSEPRLQVLATRPVLKQVKEARERVTLLVADVWKWKGYE